MSAASSFSHGGGSDRDNDSIISSQDLHDRRDNRRIIKRKGNQFLFSILFQF